MRWGYAPLIRSAPGWRVPDADGREAGIAAQPGNRRGDAARVQAGEPALAAQSSEDVHLASGRQRAPGGIEPPVGCEWRPRLPSGRPVAGVLHDRSRQARRVTVAAGRPGEPRRCPNRSCTCSRHAAPPRHRKRRRWTVTTTTASIAVQPARHSKPMGSRNAAITLPCQASPTRSCRGARRHLG